MCAVCVLLACFFLNYEFIVRIVLCAYLIVRLVLFVCVFPVLYRALLFVCCCLVCLLFLFVLWSCVIVCCFLVRCSCVFLVCIAWLCLSCNCLFLLYRHVLFGFVSSLVYLYCVFLLCLSCGCSMYGYVYCGLLCVFVIGCVF